MTDDAAGTAVLFDMDGLLIDSEPLWLQVETAVMARLGAEWTEADQAQLIGGSLDRSVRYMLSRATRPVPPDVVGEWLMSGIAEQVRRERRAGPAGRARAARRGRGGRPAARARDLVGAPVHG